MDPHEVRKLTDAVRKYQANATIEYTIDEEEDFWNKYRALLKRIHNTTDSKGRLLYYPWRAVTYKVSLIVQTEIDNEKKTMG